MLASLPARLRATPSAPRSLLLADGLFLLATMIGAASVPWWVSAHGGAAHLAWQGVVGSCCAFLAAPLPGPLGDWHDKRRLIAVGLAGLALACPAPSGAVRCCRLAIIGASLRPAGASDACPPISRLPALRNCGPSPSWRTSASGWRPMH